MVLIQEEAELHVSSDPSSSSGWLQLWGSQENFPEQLPDTGEEGGTNPSIPDRSLHCWAAGARLYSGFFTLHGCLLVTGLLLNPLMFAVGAGCASLCLLTHRYLTETMELLGVLTW